MVVEIKEEKITISNDIDIGATIAYANKNKRRPLVVLIMGTGTTDRDGNDKGLHTDLYKNLSDVFVNMDCVCVRYDKRGTHESTGNVKTTGLSDLVNDAAHVVQQVKKFGYIDKSKIIICGHSEGSLIATLLTKRVHPQGIILLSGACMGIKDVLNYQNQILYEQAQTMGGIKGWILRKTLTQEKLEKQVDDLFERAENADSNNKERYFYNGKVYYSKYMKEHKELNSKNYAQIIKEYRGKTLAITGKADLQADYKKLDSIASFDRVTVYTPERVNHILRKIDENDNNNIMDAKKQYKELVVKDIDQGVLDQIAQWIKSI